MNHPSGDPPRPRVPRTISVLAVTWVLVQLLEFIDSLRSEPGWPESRPDEFAFTVAEVLQFIYGFLIVALIVYGLVKGSRFAWFIALLWQGVQAGFGVVNFTINDYELDSYLGFSGIPFYGVVLPIAVALISYVLLLLPPTQRWIRSSLVVRVV